MKKNIYICPKKKKQKLFQIKDAEGESVIPLKEITWRKDGILVIGPKKKLKKKGQIYDHDVMGEGKAICFFLETKQIVSIRWKSKWRGKVICFYLTKGHNGQLTIKINFETKLWSTI